MELLELSATDFCCFSSFTLKLKKAGLVWITGRNKDTKSADNNGSGKSTIFKALTWALYGKTVDGEHGDGVIKDGATRATVCVLIGDRNSTYKVTRIRKTGSPILKLSKDGAAVKLPKKELQARIDSLLGLDYQAFKNTVFYGQNDSSRFADPKTRDSERKGVLHKILGLGILKLCHEETRRRRLARRKDLIAVETKIEAQKARIEEQNLSSLRAEMNQFEKIREYEQKRIEYKLEATKNDLSVDTGSTNEIKKLKKKKKKKNKKLSGLEKRRSYYSNDGLNQHRQHLIESEEKTKEKVTNLSRILDNIKSELGILDEQVSLLEGSNCPTCSSPIKKGAAKKHKQKLLGKFAEFEEKLVDAKINLKKEKERCKKITKEHSRIEKSLDGLESVKNSIAELELSISRCETSIAHLEREKSEQGKERIKIEQKIKSLTAELKKNEKEENPFVELLKKALEKARLYTAQLKTLKKKRRKVVSDLAGIEFWFRGFSNQGLPSFVLDGIMPILTDRANHYLGVLTDGDIIVDFSTQREKKATRGEMRDEIAINWTIEGVTGYPPSGGQLKKIEIATDLTLMDLAVSSGGKAPDILCLDEILDGLDEKGVQRVLLLLQDLRRKRGSIFVISHDDRMSEIFERSIIVKKKNGESKLKVAG